MQNNKKLALKYIVVTFAQCIIGVGVAFMVTSGMGNDPMGVMVSAISIKSGISFGTVTNLVNLLLFIILLLLYRKRLSFTTLITVLVVGWTIDPVCAILNNISVPTAINNYVYPILGCFILAMGVAFYLSLDMGAGIADNIILMICDFTKKSYSFGCYTLYAIYFIIGFLMGGVWGYATLVSLLLTGKIVDTALPKFKTLSKNLKLID